ncbi:hypothetical protein BCU84_00515 [Shewanella sp. 10N.286.51.B7]|uniref:DUF3291 domain-containing protein n=1 Tax=Shewanella sp. 10N.286.51.B7 TaxID=1880836 RepID=UPI000C82010C|nr:DUF3291 domain-containing protein [Shewanella sp. 10N.286.51.B7]PMG80971.1 hypothetical protein BCU84_00515 [Shewanella sp. 10N.286.51.B7]
MKLAQLNIAKCKYPLEAPEMKDFVDNLDEVNGIAEASLGFVWRLQDESGDATQIQVFDDPSLIVNMSVWEDVESLKNFMFRTHYRDFMRRKGEWFERLSEDSYVLWWVAEGHTPDVHEAKERLMHLRENGDSAYAFTFKSNFTESDIA